MSSPSPRHPAAILFIGVVLGLVSASHLLWPEAAIAGALASGLLSVRLRGRTRVVLCLLFLSFASGLIVAERANRRLDRYRQTVISLPAERFVTVRAVIDVGWKPGRDGVFSWAERFEVDTGAEVVEIDERLSIYAPGDVTQLGENDHIEIEGFLRESKSGSFYVAAKSRRLVTLSARRPGWHPRSWNRSMRAALDRHISAFPEHGQAASLIRAIALGDGSALSAEVRDSYRRGGTYHLLVFSGMQIAFAAALIAVMLRILRLGRATDVSLVTLALIAPAFVGNDPSVGRASMMVGVYGVSRLLGRPTRMTNLLFLSAALRLLVRPDDLVSPGFLLTYAATFGLVVVGRSLAELVGHPIGKVIGYGIGAELCTQPLTLLFFRHFVIGGFAVTMLLSPLLGAVLLLSIPIAIALAITSDLAWLLVEIVAQIDRVAIVVNELWSGMRLSGFAPAPPALLVVFSFAAAWTASFLSRAVPRAIAVCAMLLVVPLVVLILGHSARAAGPSIEFLDVGQGDATLIRSAKTILVDGGGSPSDPDFGRRILIPLLADRGIRELDVVVMSHPDIDHCGGLVSLVSAIPIGELWLSPRHLDAPCTKSLLSALRADSRLRFLRDGDTIDVGDVWLQVTIPRLVFKKSPLNNGSVILTARISGVRALLAGDIEREAEVMVADEAGERLHAQILKVPHHGSRSSTTSQLLDVVRPRAAVISCSVDNLYGHPARDVLRRLADRRSSVFRTDLSGSIRITLERGCMTLQPPSHQPSVRLTSRSPCS